jgi:hypothetical protein
MRFEPRADYALGVEVQVSLPELIRLESYLYIRVCA